MSKRDWRLFISDIIEAIEKIESYTLNQSYDSFINDEKNKGCSDEKS